MVSGAVFLLHNFAPILLRSRRFPRGCRPHLSRACLFCFLLLLLITKSYRFLQARVFSATNHTFSFALATNPYPDRFCNALHCWTGQHLAAFLVLLRKPYQPLLVFPSTFPLASSTLRCLPLLPTLFELSTFESNITRAAR